MAEPRNVKPRVLELFCGIGGCAAALGDSADVVAAVDLSRDALAVYARNFPHPVSARTLESLPAAAYRAWDADLWWLSPPCQPFTTRGKRRDADDPRARPFLAVIDRIAEARPRHVALENVPGFRGSRVHARLLATLERAGYAAIQERLLCPSELGVPNRRRRYYLVASTATLRERDRGAAVSAARDTGGTPAPRSPEKTLREYLDAEPVPSLAVAPELLERYDGALDIVDADDPDAVTACFTSAYGRSHVRSGSYLRQGGAVRRFSPAEILRLLGFPESYSLPPGLGPRRAWPLVGNSLSLAPVRMALAAIPELG